MEQQPGYEHYERVLRHFGKWPFVPAEDLLKLRHSLRQAQELGGPTGASELLLLVDEEVHRRLGAPRDDGPSPAAGAN